MLSQHIKMIYQFVNIQLRICIINNWLSLHYVYKICNLIFNLCNNNQQLNTVNIVTSLCFSLSNTYKTLEPIDTIVNDSHVLIFKAVNI
jgi:hypothetical protein